MFSSVTRLRVRLIRFLPSFLWYTFLTQLQVERAPGFVGGRLLVDSKNTFWTLTVWENEKAMKAFRGAGAHARVMFRLPKWCDEAAYAHWSPRTTRFRSGLRRINDSSRRAVCREWIILLRVTRIGNFRALG